MTWIDCVCDNDYEIFTEAPYQIRRKSNRKIIKESIQKSSGYFRCVLNQRCYYKHQILAMQFIPNPLNLPFVDHKNRIRTDNRLENLRWIDKSGNMKNKVSNGDYIYNYVNSIGENSFLIDSYGKYHFQNYFYDPDADKFYRLDEDQYKELRVCQHPTGLLVNTYDVNGKHVALRIRKFKKIYDIEE